MLWNGVGYAIEFLKLFLILTGLLDFRLKKWVTKAFALSVLCVMAAAYRVDLSERYSILYCLVAIGLLGAALQDKKKTGWVVFSFAVVSSVDIIFGIIGVSITGIDMEAWDSSPLFTVFVNMISLVLILVVCVWKKRKNSGTLWTTNEYIPVFVIGAAALSLYLTAVHLLEMGEPALRDFGSAGAVVLAWIFLAVCCLLLSKQKENGDLQYERDMTQHMLTAQHDYFTMLLEKEQETKAFRHDVKEHILCMMSLCEEGKYEELCRYLSQMEDSIQKLSFAHATGNPYVDVIIGDMERHFPDVRLDWVGHIPALSIPEMDICTLFYNLLKNAYEAADNMPDKSVLAQVRIQNTALVVEISNLYENINQTAGGIFLTTKEGDGHGYGLKNVRKCVERYNGRYKVVTEGGLFRMEIILPDVAV